jgi:hypothetical protein
MLAHVWNIAAFFSSVGMGQETKPGLQVPPVFGAGAGPAANFQPYIFWAYGLACLLLFLFTLFTVRETSELQRKIEYLKERLRRAHPEAMDKD